MLLEGIFLPITTPFYPDGRLYLRKLEHNVARYSLTPAAGMLILAPPGEPAALTDAETLDTFRTAIETAAKEKVMIASVGRGSVFATLALAEQAATLHYDAIALTPPRVADDAELLTYFRAVADHSSLPVVLLTEAALPLPTHTIAELATHPNIIAAIDAQASPARLETIRTATANITREVTVTTTFAGATARMTRIAEPAPGAFVSAASLGSGATALAQAPLIPALKTRTKRVGFQLLSASTKHMLEAWQAGATGAVPHLAAGAPQGCYEVWQAFKDGDMPLAEEKQAALKRAATLVEGPRGIAALKHACDLNGYFGGRPRLPRLTITAAERAEVESALNALRN